MPTARRTSKSHLPIDTPRLGMNGFDAGQGLPCVSEQQLLQNPPRRHGRTHGRPPRRYHPPRITHTPNSRLEQGDGYRDGLKDGGSRGARAFLVTLASSRQTLTFSG